MTVRCPQEKLIASDCFAPLSRGRKGAKTQYEFRAKTLTGAVRKSLARQPAQLRRNSSATIETNYANYNYETVYVFVEAWYCYTIPWSANEDLGDGAYGIDIRSYDGHGSYRGSFWSSGSWDFTARTTGEIEFAIGVPRSFSLLFSKIGEISQPSLESAQPHGESPVI